MRSRFAQRRDRVRARRREDGDRSSWADYVDPLGGCGDGLAETVIGLVVVVLLVLIFAFGWTFVLLGLDLLWLSLVFVLSLLARVLLDRPWRVEATTDEERRDWFVEGFRAAGATRDDVARRLQHGHDPQPPATNGPARSETV